jgi:ligand-binding sensor domain-containing protein
VSSSTTGFDGWLVGSEGVWTGEPGGEWALHGRRPYSVQDLDRGEGHLWVATGNGLWACPAEADRRWTQWHDETLTEVLCVRRDGDSPGAPLVAGSYGVAVCALDEAGLPRWTSLTESRCPDERYTNVLRLDADGPWLAGTEAGVLRSTDRGSTWQRTDLIGSPVRCLERCQDTWWAGTDDRGLWHSADGQSWSDAGCSSASVFSVAAAGESLLAGGYDGIHVRDASGAWNRTGPRALFRSLAVHDGRWVAAADPGGLWWSEDKGASWRRTGDFTRVSVVRAPAGGEA